MFLYVRSIPNGYDLRFVESHGKAEYGFLARTSYLKAP